MNEVLKMVIGFLVPFMLGSVITGLITWFKKNKKKDMAIADGVQCLLRAEIIRSHEKYSERESCPLYAKEALETAYEAYHNLGGNDVATRLYQETMKLPNSSPYNKGRRVGDKRKEDKNEV